MSNEQYTENAPNAGKLMQALRSTGYDNYSAIADIVDNAFDAEASNVWVDVVPGEDDYIISIADDGFGMDNDTLTEAIKLGSRTERDEASDLGKFGMGLITASISIGKRLEVITLQSGIYLTAVQDLDVIAKTNKFNKEQRNSTNEEIELFKKLTRNSHSGTLVLISKIDRIQNTNLNQYCNSLTNNLGQIFRIFISSGKSISIRGEKIRAIDPLMLDMDGTEEFSDETFEIKNGTQIESIRIRIVMLPKLTMQESDKLGINQVNQGFYLMRNNREIAAGEHLGVFTKHNNLNRFRAELYFSGSLDNAMNATFTKKGIKPQQNILDKIKVIAWPQLNSIKKRFAKDNPKVEEGDIEHERSAKIINSKSKLLLKPKPLIEIRNPRINTGTHTAKHDPTKSRIPKTAREVLSEKVNCRFELRHMDATSDFFQVDQIGKTTVVTYNIDHPFYQTMFSENQENPEVIESLDFLTYSLASAKLISASEDNEQMFRTFFTIFSTNLRTLISS